MVVKYLGIPSTPMQLGMKSILFTMILKIRSHTQFHQALNFFRAAELIDEGWWRNYFWDFWWFLFSQKSVHVRILCTGRCLRISNLNWIIKIIGRPIHWIPHPQHLKVRLITFFNKRTFIDWMLNCTDKENNVIGNPHWQRHSYLATKPWDLINQACNLNELKSAIVKKQLKVIL